MPWNYGKFILKQLDYSLSTEIPSSLIGRIECTTPKKMHAPNVTRMHHGIRMHASCVHAQIPGHAIKENKVKNMWFKPKLEDPKYCFLKADLHGTTLSHTTSLQQAYYIVSCKSNLQLAYDCLLGPKLRRRPVVSLSYATKSYRVNRPLHSLWLC